MTYELIFVFSVRKNAKNNNKTFYAKSQFKILDFAIR